MSKLDDIRKVARDAWYEAGGCSSCHGLRWMIHKAPSMSTATRILCTRVDVNHSIGINPDIDDNTVEALLKARPVAIGPRPVMRREAFNVPPNGSYRFRDDAIVAIGPQFLTNLEWRIRESGVDDSPQLTLQIARGFSVQYRMPIRTIWGVFSPDQGVHLTAQEPLELTINNHSSNSVLIEVTLVYQQVPSPTAVPVAHYTEEATEEALPLRIVVYRLRDEQRLYVRQLSPVPTPEALQADLEATCGAGQYEIIARQGSRVLQQFQMTVPAPAGRSVEPGCGPICGCRYTGPGTCPCGNARLS